MKISFLGLGRKSPDHFTFQLKVQGFEATDRVPIFILKGRRVFVTKLRILGFH